MGVADNVFLSQSEIESVAKSALENGESQSRSNTVKDMFSGVDILSLRDLTDVSDISSENRGSGIPAGMGERIGASRQILLVELVSNDQKDLLDAIEVL